MVINKDPLKEIDDWYMCSLSSLSLSLSLSLVKMEEERIYQH